MPRRLIEPKVPASLALYQPRQAMQRHPCSLADHLLLYRYLRRRSRGAVPTTGLGGGGALGSDNFSRRLPASSPTKTVAVPSGDRRTRASEGFQILHPD